MQKCLDKECPNYRRLKQVPFRGNVNADVMLVGESPGRMELVEGQPFVGPSGDLLKKVAFLTELNLDSFFLSNAAVCRIDKDAYTVKEVNTLLQHCRRFMVRAATAIKPKLIVTLGDIATWQVMRQRNIKKRHGVFVWSEEFNCWVLPTYHPAYCLRAHSFTSELITDFAKIKRFLDSGCVPIDPMSTFRFKELESLDKLFDEKPRAVALDTETQGLDWLGNNNLLISYSLCADQETAYQVYLHEMCEDNPDFYVDFTAKVGRKKVEQKIGVRKSTNFDKKLSDLVRLIESPDIIKYMFNGNFDLLFINALCIREGLPPIKPRAYGMDVQAAAHLLDENLHARASLEQVRKHFTTLDSSYSTEFDNKFDKSNMLSVPCSELSYYACADAATTYVSAISTRNRLLETKRVANYFSKFVMPTISTSLFEFANNGALVDMEQLPIVKDTISRELVSCYKLAVALIPPGVLERHTPQGIKLTRAGLIRDVLFAEDGYHLEPIFKTSKGGTFSVDAKARNYLKDKGRIHKKALEFIVVYEEWSKLNTLVTRYIKNFEQSVRSDGRIHPTYSLVTATTGRTSVNAPNLQNIPASGTGREMRRLIIAKPGSVFLALDASQAEVRWMAHCSEDPTLLEVYRNKEDVHTKTAELLLGKTRDEVPEDDFKLARKRAKSLVFGLLYGMGVYGYQKYAKLQYDIDLTIDEAKHYHALFFKTYPGIAAYHSKIRKSARKLGYVSSPLGRRRRLPEINSLDQEAAGRSERQAYNHSIQAAASDSVLLACNELLRKGLLNPKEIKAILFVHDELIFECREDRVDFYAPIIQYEMENLPLKEYFGVELKVPWVVEAKVGYNYADLEEYIT
jgi:uracil-DNA glycosylase family 4